MIVGGRPERGSRILRFFANLTAKVQESVYLGWGESPGGPDRIERKRFAGPVWKEFNEGAA